MEKFLIRSCLFFFYLCGALLLGLLGCLVWAVGSVMYDSGVDVLVVGLWVVLYLTIMGLWNLAKYLGRNV
jgi:hypothetical protein